MISLSRALPGMALLLVFASQAAADVLVFNTGRETKDGRVVEMQPGNPKLVFEEPLAGSREYERSTIKEIRWSGYDSILKLAAQGGTDPELANDFQKLVVGQAGALERAKAAQAANDLEKARTEYRGLYDALASNQEISKKLLGDTNFAMVAQSVVSELPKISFELGKRYAGSPQTQARAEALLREAATLNPNSPEYQFEFARAAEANKDYSQAFPAYQAITRLPSAPKEMAAAAQQALQRLQSVSGGQVQVATPAANPLPTAGARPGAVASQTPVPVPPSPAVRPSVVASAPTPTPAPPTVQAPAATPPPGPRWKQILWQIDHSDTMIEVKRLPEAVANGEYTGAIAGLGIVILLGWVMPYSFLAFRARRGDMFAMEYKPVAKKVGLFALVPWARKVAGQRPPKDRCPYCNKGIDNIEAYTDLNFYSCPHCRENITPIYDLKDYVDHLIAQLEMANRRKGNGGDMSNVLEKDAMLKLVRGVLTLAVRRRASDLHAESDAEGMKIRARIDGIMYEMMSLPQSIANAFVSAIKVMSNLDITEKRMPQDGKLSVWIDKTDVDLRINTSPSSLGEKVSIRVLNQKTMMVDPTRLGLDGENLEKYERTIHRPHGLVIVTGPSGSGKSTTLFVALSELNTGDKNIVTIEDPIEYHIKGISQMQVNPAANFTFATGLRSILRQDPDVIMVGEIRDKETAEIAMDAATTGHLVFTTLHTIDSPTAFARLADLGVETRRVASAVSCVMGQRLIRTICSECLKPYKPKKSDLDALGLSNSATQINFVHGAGCDNCMNTGYFGRTGIFEFLVPDETMREILEANASVSVIRELAKKNGYHSLRDQGIVKIENGTTTPEEVVRMTS